MCAFASSKTSQPSDNHHVPSAVMGRCGQCRFSWHKVSTLQETPTPTQRALWTKTALLVMPSSPAVPLEGVKRDDNSSATGQLSHHGTHSHSLTIWQNSDSKIPNPSKSSCFFQHCCSAELQPYSKYSTRFQPYTRDNTCRSNTCRQKRSDPRHTANQTCPVCHHLTEMDYFFFQPLNYKNSLCLQLATTY